MTTVMPIVCKGIRKKFGQGDLAVPILKGIDLEVNFGELLILSGPSGSGKTTLLSIIANILKQDEGEIFLLGKNLMLLSNDERVLFRSQHLGFIFQSFNLFPYLTALENIAIPLILTGFTKKNALEIASVSLAKIGLSAKGSVCVSLLSGGEQQRVAIARAIVSNPKIVICDEPTSALDQVSGLHVMGVLREISREQEKTVIVVTHDCRTYPFADRIAKINDGRITEIVSSQDEV